ncbi:hypothetical protein G039_0330260 [Pseudomonas aeruginosa VRFPA01]|nr:hypothetical protein G039_0330260 [Pseudomonas aeruginosa VRFPA01]
MLLCNGRKAFAHGKNAASIYGTGQAEERLDLFTERPEGFPDATETIGDLAALLDSDHPDRHAAGQTGNNVSDLCRQLPHRLLVLPRGQSGDFHRIRRSEQPFTLFLEPRAVGRKALGINQLGVPGLPQAFFQVVELLQLTRNRIDRSQQLGQLRLLLVELGRGLGGGFGGSLLGRDLLLPGTLGVVVGVHRRRLGACALLPTGSCGAG